MNMVKETTSSIFFYLIFHTTIPLKYERTFVNRFSERGLGLLVLYANQL